MGRPERGETEEVTICIGEQKVCWVKGVSSFHMYSLAVLLKDTTQKMLGVCLS